jgi:hypothetical protein
MQIILKRIPEKTKKRDIDKFLAPVLKGTLFQKSGSIESIKILVLHDPKTNEVEWHGLVSFDSEKIALRVIRRLNRKYFLGKYIAVSEYHRRSWENDRRVSSHDEDRLEESKRKSDRRRVNLKERKITGIKYIHYHI